MSARGVSSSMMRPASSKMTRSARRSTSAMLWEASSTVALRSRAYSFSLCRIQSAVSGSSEAVGSSSNNNSGALSSALARPARVDGEILLHREPRGQVDIGALEVQPLGHVVTIAAHIGAEHPDFARTGHDKPQQHGDGRGLAGAVAAEQSHGRAGLDG